MDARSRLPEPPLALYQTVLLTSGSVPSLAVLTLPKHEIGTSNESVFELTRRVFGFSQYIMDLDEWLGITRRIIERGVIRETISVLHY
jgi:hypothetical protein